jgi:hypothetical protein
LPQRALFKKGPSNLLSALERLAVRLSWFGAAFMLELQDDLAETWLTSRGFPGLHSIGQARTGSSFVLPTDSGVRVDAAHRIARCYEGGEALFGVMQLDIFPSAEDRFVFTKFLESGGIVGAPDPTAFILFEQQDWDYLRGALALSLLFVYEGFLASAGKNSYLWFSHDEWIRVVDPTGESHVEELLVNFEFKRI